MQRDDFEKASRPWVAAPRTTRALHIAIAALSGLFLLLFLYAAFRRMRYPFEVEWIESNVLVSVLRIVHGQGLYVAPTPEFVPFLYAPLYLYLSAALTRLVGTSAQHGFLALRLLSTLATLGSGATIYALVLTETRRKIAAITAAGLFLAGYAVMGSFYDVGRVDSLFVCFLLLALLAQRRDHPVGAALLWVLAFQTKQTILPLALLILCAEWQRPRRMLAALATFLVTAGLSILWLNHATSGWYVFYIFKVARGLALLPRQIVLYLPQMVLEPVAIAWVVIAAAALLTGVRLRCRKAMFYLFVSFALFAGTWFVEGHAGASANAMMPAYAWTAVLLGISLSRLLTLAEEQALPQVETLALLAVALQFLALIYNPGRFIPPTAARTETQAFIDKLHALPGDVGMVNHSYDLILAGKHPTAEGEAFGAILDAKLGAVSEHLQADLDARIKAHRYSAIVIDNLDPRASTARYDREYPFAVSTGLIDLRYMTSQPQWILLPCNAPRPTLAIAMTPGAMVEDTGCTRPPQ